MKDAVRRERQKFSYGKARQFFRTIITAVVTSPTATKFTIGSNGVTGFQRTVPGTQVKLYPVGYPAASYPQTHVKMKKIAP
jgi:hypothetical protein